MTRRTFFTVSRDLKTTLRSHPEPGKKVTLIREDLIAQCL